MAGLRNRMAFKKYPEYSDAILALGLNAAFSIEMNDYNTLNWYGQEIRKPTEEEIKAKLNELLVEYEAQTYRWERYKNYLTVEEQLNQLWDDMNSGIISGKENSEWFNYIKDIKEQNPKPTTES
jgi:hypothetical protein